MQTLRYLDNVDPSENIAILRMSCAMGEGGLLPHDHEFVEIVYCLEGGGTQYVEKNEYPMQRGSLLFLNYGQWHSFRSDIGMEYYNIVLMPSFLSETLINTVDILALLTLADFSDFSESVSMPPQMVQLAGVEMLEIEDLIKQMEREFLRKETGYRTALHGYMTALFSKIFRKISLKVKVDTLTTRRSIAPEIITYIEEHLDEKITLSDLAHRAYYAPSYFCRVFREFTGHSLTEYIHRRRIDQAVKLLETTDHPVAKISAMVGYSDKKQFYRRFRQYAGTTPSVIRRGS